MIAKLFLTLNKLFEARIRIFNEILGIFSKLLELRIFFRIVEL